MLKAEAEGGVRQGTLRSHNTSNRPAINVACAFDGFTWRLPREPIHSGNGTERGGEPTEDAGSLVWNDEDWVKQRSLVEVRTRRQGSWRFG